MTTSLFQRVPYGRDTDNLYIYDVQEADYLAVQEWLDRHLRGDYLFKKGHLLSIIRRPASKLYAVMLEGIYCGTVVYYAGSILHNIMIDPEYRGRGIGEAVIKHLEPKVIRAKSNMVAGDPVPFYQAQGYEPVGLDPARPHIVIMEKPKEAAATPPGAGAAPAVPVQPGLPVVASRPAAGALLLPPELDTTAEDAAKWRAYKKKQKERQKQRTMEQQQLAAHYARRYDPNALANGHSGESDNGIAVHSE